MSCRAAREELRRGSYWPAQQCSWKQLSRVLATGPYTLHRRMQGTTTTSGTPMTAMGLFGGLMVACLLTWHLSIPMWETVHAMGRVSSLVLAWCMLKRQHGSSQKFSSFLGMTMAALWLANCARLAFFIGQPSQEHVHKFQRTSVVYPMLAVYAVECTLMMVLLHRLAPSWVCILIGVLRALLNTSTSYSYTTPDKASGWHAALSLLMDQVSQLWLRWRCKSAGNHSILRDPYSVAQRFNPEDAGQLPPDQALDRSLRGTKDSDEHFCAVDCNNRLEATASFNARDGIMTGTDPTAGSSREVVSIATGATPTALHPRQSFSPQNLRTVKFGNGDGGSMAEDEMRFSAAARAIMDAPYKPQLRTTHTVSMKLDTYLHYSRLPADVAVSLQEALCSSMGPTAAMHINDMAVRPGCICITMKMEQPHPAGSVNQAEPLTEGAPSEALAHALVPALQSMLSTGQDPASMQRAVLQFDDHLVTCIWRVEKQAWDVQIHPVKTQPQVNMPWLGVATASCLRFASLGAIHGSTEQTACGLLEVLAEVQLWGVSKVADVEGWTPPQQHQDSELQWPGAQQPSGSSPALKLLARAAGGYLPTQVVRLVPGSTEGYVTVQVLVQLHEHQLVRHHEGGSPSTLLLMDLELWQNEVLLSSSPLLSLPAVAETSCNSLATHAWWWGAADSTVAKAVAEVQQFARGCVNASTDSRAATVIQTCVKFTGDLAAWLAQVQRTAHASQLCCFSHAVAAAATGTATSTAVFHQPCQTPTALKQLGEDLMQYAKYLGWQEVYRMVSEQKRSVVLKAATRQHLHHSGCCKPTTTWQAAQAVLFGYPCQHDELLYKQLLAGQLSGVVVTAGTAAALIGAALSIRALMVGEPVRSSFTLVWCMLQTAAVICMLRGRVQQHQGWTCHTATRMAYWLTMVAYVFRASIHLVFALCSTPAYHHFYLWAFHKPVLWAAMKLVTMLSDQVPASVVLPATWITGMAILLEFPALLIDVLRGARWHPAVSVVAAFFLAVGVRALLGTQLRKQLAPVTARMHARQWGASVAARCKSE